VTVITVVEIGTCGDTPHVLHVEADNINVIPVTQRKCGAKDSIN